MVLSQPISASGATDSGPHFLKALSNYTVRVGSDVTFTCQVEKVDGYKVKPRPIFVTKTNNCWYVMLVQYMMVSIRT